MEKDKILQSLQERAQEQQILRDVPFAKCFIFLSTVLGENPWKIVIPLSFGITILLHIFWGNMFDNAIFTVFKTL